MNVLLLERNLSGRAVSLQVDGRVGLQAGRLRWDIAGGPLDGIVEVSGITLEDLARLLRCEVRVTAADGSPAWWGYVWGVQTEYYQMDLDDVWNRIAVRYRDESPAPSIPGYAWMTAWAEDSDSVRQYGYKEKLVDMDQARPGEPEAVRAAELVKCGRPRWRPNPQPLPVPGRGAERSGDARLLLRGWWDTLGWQYYAQAAGYLGNTAGGTIQNLGDAAANTMAAQMVLPAAPFRLRDVWLRAGRFGSPADNLVVDLCANGAGAPGAVLDTSTLAGTAISGGVNWNRFVMAGTNLAGATPYWLRVWRTAGVAGGAYYRLGVDEGAGYAVGAPLLWNGAAWVALAGDLCFTLNGEQDTTAQVVSIVQGSQFFAGCLAQTASGLMGRQYRDGTRTAGVEAAELLGMGVSGGARLICLVGPDRIARISAEPVLESSFPDFEIEGGRVTGRDGWPVENGSQVVGRVAAVRGITRDAGAGAWSPYVLVKGAEWTKDGGLQAKW